MKPERLIGFIIFVCISCNKTSIQENNSTLNPVINSTSIKGFNQNWSFLPAFTQEMLTNVNLLKPQILRYPGGTITHSWDWINGIKTGSSNGAPHPVGDIKTIANFTNAKMIYVLDIVNRSLTDQLELLGAIKNLGLPIEYIELGNELYSQDSSYITKFPTGTEYANKAAEWINQIRLYYPTAKISVMLQCRNSNSSNVRLNEWNSLVVNNNLLQPDAYTYHVYIPTGGSFASRIVEFETVLNNTNTGNKELWITEYGNDNPNTDPNYLPSLDSLANYLENYPRVTIAMNHLIIGNNKNKLNNLGTIFTPEGQLFLNRAASR